MIRTLARLAVLASPAFAQSHVVVKQEPARLVLHSSIDGAVLQDPFVDIDGLLGLGGSNLNHWDVVLGPGGELWVSSASLMEIHRFSSSGGTYLGDVPMSPGGALGMESAFGRVWCAALGGAGAWTVSEYDAATGVRVGQTPAPLVWDVVGFGGELLLAKSSGELERWDPITGVSLGTLAAPGGFLQQAVLSSSGGLLVVDRDLPGVLELSSSGGIGRAVALPSVVQPRGIAPLANGRLLVSAVNGVFSVDPASGSTLPLDGGDRGGFVFASWSDPFAFAGYCDAATNITGVPSRLTASGSNAAAANELRLTASELPPQQFGMFLCSRTQAFIPGANGASNGNLCLGGVIGRFRAPSQLRNSGTNGRFSLDVDLTALPQGAGTVGALAGETWNFQAWHRSPAGLGSNFTGGVAIAFQ